MYFMSKDLLDLDGPRNRTFKDEDDELFWSIESICLMDFKRDVF